MNKKKESNLCVVRLFDENSKIVPLMFVTGLITVIVAFGFGLFILSMLVTQLQLIN